MSSGGNVEPVAAVAASRPLRRDAVRNRARIVSAAGEMFARQGLDVSMEEIASAAGVGVGTIYRRFPNKEAIIEALFAARAGVMADLARHALSHDDAWGGLVWFLEHATALLAADRGLVQILFESPIGRRGLEHGRRDVGPIMAQLVERAQRDGRLRPDVDGTDMILLQLTVSNSARYTRSANPELWRRHLAVLIDGLRTQRRRPSALPLAPLGLEDLDAVFDN